MSGMTKEKKRLPCVALYGASRVRQRSAQSAKEIKISFNHSLKKNPP